MRSAPQLHRRRRKAAARIRRRRQPIHPFGAPESVDEDDEVVVEIGGGPADDKPASG